jgi:NAD(P)-dependent dehydrogenase (short-subunit alcohol dehydrogenase family)
MTDRKQAADPETPKGVLITGCSSGIGRAAARRLAQRGFTVFAGVRRESDAEDLRAGREPNLVPVHPLDLARRDQIAAATETVKRELERRALPGLYALIHNAGGGSVAPVEWLDLDAFQTELQARVVGTVALTQAALPLLRRGRGRILWIVTPGLMPTPYVASIHACDFAVNCIARTLEIELKPWDIPNVLIRCGGIRTRAGMRTVPDVEELLRRRPKESLALYESRLQEWTRDMAAFDEKRTDPAQVADVILRALVAGNPKRRYSVGYLAGAAALLEDLPSAWADAILKSRF